MEGCTQICGQQPPAALSLPTGTQPRAFHLEAPKFTVQVSWCWKCAQSFSFVHNTNSKEFFQKGMFFFETSLNLLSLTESQFI